MWPTIPYYKRLDYAMLCLLYYTQIFHSVLCKTNSNKIESVIGAVAYTSGVHETLQDLLTSAPFLFVFSLSGLLKKKKKKKK